MILKKLFLFLFFVVATCFLFYCRMKILFRVTNLKCWSVKNKSNKHHACIFVSLHGFFLYYWYCILVTKMVEKILHTKLVQVLSMKSVEMYVFFSISLELNKKCFSKFILWKFKFAHKIEYANTSSVHFFSFVSFNF